MARKKKKKDDTDAVVENEIPWAESKARKILYDDIKSGTIPLKSKDDNNRYTQPRLREIYEMHEEYKEYDYKNFSRRVSSARKTIRKAIERKQDDQIAFDNFVEKNDIIYHSDKGYIQWKGSEAHKLCTQHVKDKFHERMNYRDNTNKIVYKKFDFKKIFFLAPRQFR